MDVKSISSSLRSQIRSGSTVNSFKQCVLELVLNSLDAKAFAIAIRINFASFKIQVVDNGFGISYDDLELVGTRHTTSKCESIKDLETKPKYFGFRGEALASIISLSKTCSIVSRAKENQKTYCKKFNRGKFESITEVLHRPSQGTTVTIEDFLYNLPVRKEQIKPNLDLEEIRFTIESLSFVNYQVSFSIRNDLNKKIIFQSSRSETIAQALKNEYSDIDVDHLEQLQVKKNKVTVTGLIYKYPYSISKIKLLYLNRRPIENPDIHKFIKNLFSKSIFYERCIDVIKENEIHAMYLINISCPNSQVNIISENNKTLADFKNCDLILKCIEKMVTMFLKQEKVLTKPDEVDEVKCKQEVNKRSSDISISEIKGVFKSIPAKRKREQVEKRDKKQFTFANPVISLANCDLKNDNQISTGYESFNDKINENELDHNLRHFENFNDKIIENDLIHFDNFNDKKESIFARHQNTQSLVLNSELETEKLQVDEMHLKSAPTEPERKGKDILMDLYLKSTLLYRSESPKSIFNCMSSYKLKNTQSKKGKDEKLDSNTTMTVSVKIRKQTEVVKSSVYSIKRAIESKNKCKKYKEVEVQTNDQGLEPNFDFRTSDKNNKFVQTTLERKEKIKTTDDREFQLQINFGNINENYFKYLPENTLYNILNQTFQKSFVINSSKQKKRSCFEDEKFHCCYNGKSSKNCSDLIIQKCCCCCCCKNVYYVSRDLKLYKNQHCNNNKKHFNSNKSTQHKESFDYFNFKDGTEKYRKYKNKMNKYDINYGENLRRHKKIKKRKVFTNEVPDVKSKMNFANTDKDDDFEKLSYDSHANYLSLPQKSVASKNVHKDEDIINLNQNNNQFDFVKPFLKNTKMSLVEDNSKYISNKRNNISADKSQEEWHSRKEKLIENNKVSEESPIMKKKNETFQLNLNDGNVEIIAGKSRENDYKMKKEFSLFDKYPSEEHINSNYLKKIRNAEVLNTKFTFDVKKKTTPEIDTEIRNNSINPRSILSEPVEFVNALKTSTPYVFLPKDTIELNKFTTSERERNKCKDKSFSLKKFQSDPTGFFSTISNRKTTDILSQPNFESSNKFKLFSNGNKYTKEKCLNNFDVECSNFNNGIGDEKKQESGNDSGEENLLITLISEGGKNMMIENDLSEENKANDCSNSDIYSYHHCTRLNSDKEINDGDFQIYNNEINGKKYEIEKDSSLNSNKENCEMFTFSKRIDFMPKGYSPILNFNTDVKTELSQNSKEALLDKIMKSYEYELKQVKWEKITNEQDAEIFLENYYADECHKYAALLPILGCNPSVGRKTSQFFSKDIFKELNVVGQADKKFIIVYAVTQKSLIIVDQHAAHERIRLETLFKKYTCNFSEDFVCFRESKLNSVIDIKLPEEDMTFLDSKEFVKHFEKLGLSYSSKEDSIQVFGVPTCILNKAEKNNFEGDKRQMLNLLITSLIKEELEFYKKSRYLKKTIPNIFVKVISLEACRGAIKFGDSLLKEECEKMIKALSLCQLPFQCAHGRPTMVPLANIEHFGINKKKTKLKFNF